jgi:hypothetical protein
MKALWIALLLTLSINAQALTVDECSSVQAEFGKRAVGEKDVNIGCYDLFKSKASPKAIVVNHDQKIEVIGFQNSFYIKNLETDKFLITAGDSSKLMNVIAVDYNSENEEVYVLEEALNEVKIYPSNLMGNIAPYRTIKTDELLGASDLVSYKDKIFVLNEMTNSILVYDRAANIYALEGNRKLELLNKYESIPVNVKMLNLTGDMLELKDSEGNMISSIDLKN